MTTGTGKPWIDNAYVIWVCQCCMFIHANGECCTERAPMHDDGTFCFEGAANCYRGHTQPVDGSAPLLHGGDGREPLSALSPDDGVAMGMGSEEHGTYCLQRMLDWENLPGDYECECETNTFSTSSCDGCGSYLAGERHAMTVYPGERTQTK